MLAQFYLTMFSWRELSDILNHPSQDLESIQIQVLSNATRPANARRIIPYKTSSTLTLFISDNAFKAANSTGAHAAHCTRSLRFSS